MVHKPAKTIEEQISILKERGMRFSDEEKATAYLGRISYYRLKGYWWDMQVDPYQHTFQTQSHFEDVIQRYDFDQQLRSLIFNAIDTIEIALRTKMIYHLSLDHEPNWYQNEGLFQNENWHRRHILKLFDEWDRSDEPFAQDHRQTLSHDPASWKIMEVASLGSLSKLFKNLKKQLPVKAKISRSMGLNIHSELSSWMESITYLRNVVAHHSRLWGRLITRRPRLDLNNPRAEWLQHPITPLEHDRVFSILSCILFVLNQFEMGDRFKSDIFVLLSHAPQDAEPRYGFANNWQRHPLWQ